eukprot:TRINITY_DN2818_c0_g2_i2.p1 TRINITY_DN2818_c0_g2~~TRINITY_DN2818_c0_g2_i2.p1  ORF type:complete len:186 (-),score=49.15 TRINITY_DN2818_c0_g2_i2:221-733(-)
MSDTVAIKKQIKLVEGEACKLKKEREESEAELVLVKAVCLFCRFYLILLVQEHTRILQELEQAKKEREEAERTAKESYEVRVKAQQEACVAEEVRRKLERLYLGNNNARSKTLHCILTLSESLPKDAKKVLLELMNAPPKESFGKPRLPVDKSRQVNRAPEVLCINQPRK